MKLFTGSGMGDFPTPDCDLPGHPKIPHDLSKSPSLFIIKALRDSIHEVLGSLGRTVTDCSDEIKPGLYRPNNVFVFLADDCDGDSVSLREAVFADWRVRRHQHVAVLAYSSCGVRNNVTLNTSHLVLHRYNIYQDRQVPDRVVRPEETAPTLLLDFFPAYEMEVSDAQS